MSPQQRTGRGGGGLGTLAAAGLLGFASLRAGTSGSAATGGADPTRDPTRDPAEAADQEATRIALEANGIKGAVERFQFTRRPLAFVVGVIKKFTDDRASKLAALIAYYGFFSIFPALLALVTILGMVLEGNDSLRDDIRDSALAQFPVIGEQISGALSEPLSGSTVALVIGLGGALWAGMGAMQAVQDALNSIWDVARADWPKFVAKRLRSLAGLVLVALLFGATAIVPVVVGEVTFGPLTVIGLVIASAVVDSLAFLGAFRLLCVAKVGWRQLVPGAVTAGLLYLGLQAVGTLYVDRTVQGAQDTYGTFALVIGLLSWMFLLAQMTMIAAEVNVVAARRLWPRTLFGPPTTRGDRRSVAAQAESERSAENEDVDVSFSDGVSDEQLAAERAQDEAVKQS